MNGQDRVREGSAHLLLSRLRARLEQPGLAHVRPLQAALGRGALPHEEFDRAFLVTVPGEIPDRLAALREICSSLKPGRLLSHTEVLPDPHYQRRRTVERLAAQAGFQVADTFGSWWAFTINLVRPPRTCDRTGQGEQPR
ncbi:MAG: hypothetical protein FJ125_07780 [Deltaproteobacteria bacterium]|nr:hypothetical protein [Deltaproteobacteria bacterium]